ncbi:hypothetical protein E2C01_011406 [Portunus trituberculatus]|uniref:Uncharacterized protein n=1 Tax=Portunus trituberculatus TaxID=210409 RepID=A0A5B7DB06_PORTR|nr:hypothetical protein [Portunus trituberculatus]
MKARQQQQQQQQQQQNPPRASSLVNQGDVSEARTGVHAASPAPVSVTSAGSTGCTRLLLRLSPLATTASLPLAKVIVARGVAVMPRTEPAVPAARFRPRQNY